MANMIRGFCVAAIGVAYVTECLSPWLLIGIMFIKI